MITKTLRTSDGDYSTIADMITDIKSNFWPFSDDMTVNVEGGASFGSETDFNNFGAATTGWNGHTLTIQTDPSEITNTAKLFGRWGCSGGSATGSVGLLKFNQIMLFTNDNGTNDPMFSNSTIHAGISLINCLACYKADGGAFYASQNSVQQVSNCTILYVGRTTQRSTAAIKSGSNTLAKNNIVCTYKSTALDIIPAASSYGTYCLIYYYGGGSTDASTEPTHIVNQDPKFVDAALQGATESLATIAARNLRLQSDSPAIDSASGAELVDIIGNSRA